MGNADYGQGAGTLSKAAKDVRDAKAKFDQLSKELSGQLEGMKVKWVGQGGTAFTNLHTMWTEKQTKIVRTLDDLADKLDTTEKNNTANDEQQNSVIAKLAAKLG